MFALPVVSNIVETCNGANTHYTVSFDLSGGTGGPYTVIENLPGGIGGSWTGSTWTSNLIPSGTDYDFNVDDVNGCGPVNVNGSKTCNCSTDAGTMDATPLSLCETDTAFATHNADETFDANDNILYVLHTSAGGTIGTVLDTNTVAPNFGFSNPPLSYGTTYYISAVVGDSLGIYVDAADPCFSVAIGTPVVWNEMPSAGLDSLVDNSICDTVNSLMDLNTLVNGNSAVGTWAETTSSGQFTIATGEFDAGTLTAGTYSFTYIVSSTTCPDDTAWFDVNVVTAPTFQNVVHTCNGANTAYTVSFEVIGGDGGPYTVAELLPGSVGGSFVGNVWTSGLITSGVNYSFGIDDVNGCGPANVNGVFNCNCATNAGTMDVTLLSLCETDVALAIHNDDEAFDANDNLIYILHTNSGASLGTVLDTNGLIPSFSFSNPPLSYGTTYYISAIAGDSLGSLVDFADGCLSVAIGTPVVWNQMPDAGLDSLNNTICNSVGSLLDLNTLLNGNSAVGTWVETSASGQFTAGTGILDGNGLASGLYTFEYTVTGTSCPDDIALFEVTVNSMETAGSDNLGSICSDQTIDLNTLLIGNSIGGTWSETTSSGQLNASSGVFDAANLVGGVYTFEYEVQSPCGNDTAIFTITVSEVVASFIASPVVGTIPLNVTLDGTLSTGAIVLWEWDFDNDGILDDFNPSTSNVYTTIGSYTVALTVTGAAGCTSTITVTIDAFGESTLIIPNIFTPNGDGSNDVFNLSGTNITDIKGTIMNRWGQVVFNINTVEGGWDGRTMAGIECSEGVYYYLIHALGADGVEYNYQGPIELIR